MPKKHIAFCTGLILGSLLLLAIAARMESGKPLKEPRPPLKEWPQKCLTCGAEWIVMPVRDRDEAVPPTVEWCFHDGSYCNTGMKLVFRQWESEEAYLAEMVPHCKECFSCKAAAFTPESWAEALAK